jgi:hypothetical protein
MSLTAAKPSEAGLTKCWVLWKNGNKKSFRSYDSSGRYEVANPREYGIRNLKKMVEKWGPTVDKAILYDTATGQPIEHLQDGQWMAAQA